MKLRTNLKTNLYTSLQLFRKDLRGLNGINDFSKQYSIFFENKTLVKMCYCFYPYFRRSLLKGTSSFGGIQLVFLLILST